VIAHETVPFRCLNRLPLTRGFLCVAMVVIAGCNSPTEPRMLPPSYWGTWTGTHQITSCVGGYDPRSCGRMPRVGSLRITLRDSGDAISGTLTIEAASPFSENNPYLTMVTIPVLGAVSGSGELHLDGSMTFTPGSCGVASSRLAEWSTRRVGNEMTGRITVITSGFYTNFCYPQTFQVTSDLRDVSEVGVPHPRDPGSN